MAKRRRNYQKRNPDQWKQLVADQRSSGQSVRGFARARGICESSMGHWSRLVRCSDEPDLDEVMPTPSGDKGSGRGGLVELVTQHQQITVETSSDEVRLLVGTGVCLALSQLPAPEYLALVAHAYEGVSS